MERSSSGRIGVAVRMLLQGVNVNVAVYVNGTEPNC
jgi:hypothetical protein